MIISLFKKLKFVFSYGEELEKLLKEERKKIQAAERELNFTRLDLCKEHQQKSYGSHYAKHNCDHCKLLEAKEELTRENFKLETSLHDVKNELMEVRETGNVQV